MGIVSELNKRVSEEGGEESEAAADLAWMLYDTALLNSGFTMESSDAANFAARMFKMMKSPLNLESLELEPELEVPEEEEEEEEEEGEEEEGEEEEEEEEDAGKEEL